MSQNEIEAIKNMIVLGKPARDFDVSACTDKEQIYAWRNAFWIQFEASFPGNKDIQDFMDVFGEDYLLKTKTKLDELSKAEHFAKPVLVKGVAYTAIMKFPVLHCGWESDGEGALVNTNEGRKLVLSNHGRNYFAKAKELEGILNGYLDVVDQTELALKLLSE